MQAHIFFLHLLLILLTARLFAEIATRLRIPSVIGEITALFPDLDPVTGQGYSPAARRMLRCFEARLLQAERRVA